MGITKEQLEKSKALEPMLRGYKSPFTFPIEANFSSIVMKTDARLSFRPNNEGNVVLAIHGIRKQPELNRLFFGLQFTDEDKKNLQESGNMGRIVDIKNYHTGELVPSFISIDKQTNELVSMKTSFLKLPDEVKGVKLDDKQKASLMEGKAVLMENMISPKIRFFLPSFWSIPRNAGSNLFSKRKPKVHLATRKTTERRARDTYSQDPCRSGFIRRQQTDLQDDKSIYLKGLKDKKGQEYNAYVKVNH